MKLIQLDLEGFTAFRAPTSIRFDGLELFAIWGPTGAGKSSLLDAITFALFGKVERLGSEVKALRSSGAAALGVQLEFEAGGERFRVTRKLRAAGTQKILLERAEGDGWIDAGDGADKVKPVEARIERILGIDYDGFVRTVILPQGQFSRFLNGEPKERREILSKLLGLEIYGRMMKRANTLHLSLKDQATGKSDMLERSMADATPEKLAELEAQLRDAAIQIDALEQRRKLVDELVDRDAEHAARASSLRAILDVVEAAIERTARARARAGELDAARAAITPRLADADGAFEAARATREGLELQLQERIGSHGDDATLRAWRDAALELARLTEEQHRFEAARSTGVATITDAETAAGTLLERVGAAAADRDRAERALQEAEDALEAARRADHAGAACAGLGPGDPCPVCATPLPDPLPARPDVELDAATRRRDGARTLRDRAAAALDAAEDARRGHETTLERYRDRLREIDEALAELAPRIGEARARLADAPIDDADPLATLDAELAARDTIRAELETARRGERDADAARAAIADEAATIDRDLDELRAREDGARAGFRSSLGELPSGLVAPAEPVSDEAIAAFATQVRQGVMGVAAERDELREEARRLADGAPAGSILDLRDVLDAERRRHEHALGALTARRDGIETQIAMRATLQAEVAELAATADRYRAVAEELKSNRFVEWLQHDALRSLCRAGNEHLEQLSGGRYKLRYDDGAFAVLDAWSADEQRSAKTLSGGETFLASLSLALSLADEIARVRIGDAARLESLFLDEGFGTLDSETLQEVEEALDRLARTGRTIGVITHIKELAERLPVRIQVTKHPSGSTVEILG